MPDMMVAAARFTDVMPEPQKRSMRDAGGAHVIARIERRHAAEIPPLLADLGGGAPDDVVDMGRVDAGAFGQRLQHGGAEVLRVHVGQRALAVRQASIADAARRAAGVA
jgi:hypothetical protein